MREAQCFHDDAGGEHGWDDGIMDTSSADWSPGWLHPSIFSVHPRGLEPPHTFAPPPSPWSHRLHSGAALPDSREPVLAGRLRRRPCYLPPATSPIFLGFTTVLDLAASLHHSIVLET